MPRKKKKYQWTEKRMAYLMAWKGNDMEAARAAGFGSPEKAAFRLSREPEMAEAIEKKRQQMVDYSAKKIATKASKMDVVERALKLADMLPEKTNNNISGQVAALKLVAEMQGHIIRKHEDVTKQFDGKTDEDKEFFAVHGYFPPQEPNTIN